MPWHRAGSVQVTQGSNLVTGDNALFPENVRVGDGFVGPDGLLYEVLNLPDEDKLTIFPDYIGASTTSSSYGVIPVQGYVKQAADRLNEIVRQYGDALAVLGDEEKIQLILDLADSMTEAALDFTAQESLEGQRTYLRVNLVDNTPDAQKPISEPAQQAFDTKVDKVDGKQLSTNDFTNGAKTKLDDLPDRSQLDTTFSAKVDKQEGYQLSQTNFSPAEKTKLGELPSIAGLNTLLAGKVDKQEGYQLTQNNFSDAYKGKLDALPSQAGLESTFATKVDKVDGYGLSKNNYSDADKAKVASIEASPFLGEYLSLGQLQAEHPTARPGDYANIDLGEESDVQRALWDSTDSKWVLASLGSGQMTPAQVKQAYELNGNTNAYTDDDKAKVDGIEAGAQVNYAAVDQAEAEGGASEALRSWSALRVRQAVAAWWSGSSAKTKLDSVEQGAQVNLAAGTQGEAEGGGADLRSWSSARLFQAAAAWWAGSDAKTKLDGVDTGAQKNPDLVSQAVAEGGSGTSVVSWSALRVRQAITAWWTGSSEKTKLDGIETGAQKNPANGTQLEAEQGASGTYKSWSALNLHQAASSWFVNSTYKTKLDQTLKATGGTAGANNRVWLDVPGITDAELNTNLVYSGALEIREVNQVAQNKGGSPLYAPAISFHYGGYTVNRLWMDSGAVLRWGGSKVALDTDAVGVGVGQTWRSFATGRALNTSYVNDTGRTIAIMVFGGPTSATNVGYGVRIDGVEVRSTYMPSGLYTSTGPVLIPPGATYSVVVYNGSCPINTWSELR